MWNSFLLNWVQPIRPFSDWIPRWIRRNWTECFNWAVSSLDSTTTTDFDVFFSLWNVQQAINGINQTYEIDETIDAWNYRSHTLLTELKDQTSLFSCSGGVWTQTTDVEGEVNGLHLWSESLEAECDTVEGWYPGVVRCCCFEKQFIDGFGDWLWIW